MTITLAPVPNRTPVAPALSVPAALLREECDLEIVIPSLNEERRLPATLRAVIRELEALDGVTSRIVIVDNGSCDRTAEVVDRLSRPDGPQLTVIGCATRGKGAAVRQGIVTSRARIVGFLDADLSVPTTTLGAALRRIAAGSEVVIASRRCAGASYEVLQPRFRRLGSWAFRSLIGSLVPGVQDSQCGFKFFTLTAARRIFNDMDVTGFAFDVEMLMRASRLGYRIDELPVTWSDDTASTLSVASHAGEIARDVVRLHRLDAALARRARFELVAPTALGGMEIAPIADAFEAIHLATQLTTLDGSRHERTDLDGTGFEGTAGDALRVA